MYFRLIILVLTLIYLFGCEDSDNKEKDLGCTDPSALNYDPEATEDDDSCIYECPDNSSFVLLTTNGGLDWKELCLFQYTGWAVVDISVIDTNNIWFCSAGDAKILHTPDGGESWNVQYYDTTQTTFFNYIEMFDTNNGVAMGDGKNDAPIILRTTDGGQTWIQMDAMAIGPSSGDTWRRIDFINIDVGYFINCCNTPQLLYKTIDGGINWTPTNYPGGMQVLKFYNEDIGFVIKGEQEIYRTLDGGESWETFTTPHSGWGMDIEFDSNDPGNVWILTDDVYFSADTGKTWTAQTDLNLNGKDLLITGEEGWIMRYEDIYHSQSAVDGSWDLISIDFPEDGSAGFAIDGAGDQIIAVPGKIRK